ncbi:MAG: hypothetical protein IT306_07460 [Chloroflexi bacterium]|nr:hypothetical protein [Chloroflexota bacterium]
MSNPSEAARAGSLRDYGALREQAIELVRAAADGLPDDALAAALFGIIGPSTAATGASWTALLPAILSSESALERRDGRWRLAERARRTNALLRPPDRAQAANRRSAPAPAPTPADASPSSPAASAAVGPAAAQLPEWTLGPSPSELSTFWPSLLGAPGSDDILAMALVTTGADPRTHRIVRLAIAALHPDGTVSRLDAPIRVEQRLPGYLQAGARTRYDDLAEGYTWDELVPSMLALAQARPIHVYGAARARVFIAAELERAELPPLPLPLIEADTLLRGLLPGDRKPGPVAAARELGVPYREPGVPVADAEALARVVGRLRERQRSSPSRAVTVEIEEQREGYRPLPFTRAWLANVPDWPGVYTFLDEAGQALYVGKAVSLARRLGDYVRRQPSAHRSLDALAVRTVDVSIRSTASDLEAALLEARLIRELQPEFNVARGTRAPRTIIRADPDAPSPSVRLVSETAADGARYFGPLTSGKSAQTALKAARAAYPDAFLRKRTDTAAQRQAVLNVCALLSGQKGPARALLQQRMREAAARGDAAAVAALRQALRDVQALELQPSVVAGLGPGASLLLLEPIATGYTRLHLIRDGELLVSVSWGVSALPNDPDALRALEAELLAARAETRPSPPPQAIAEPEDDDWDDDESADVSVPPRPFHPDDCALVMRWLAQARGRIEVARVPRRDHPADD